MEILNVFITLKLWNKFSEKRKLFENSFFKKLGYRFLVESTNIENVSFPYKTVMAEANVKTNRMVSTKWTYQKEQSFTSN